MYISMNIIKKYGNAEQTMEYIPQEYRFLKELAVWTCRCFAEDCPFYLKSWPPSGTKNRETRMSTT